MNKHEKDVQMKQDELDALKVNPAISVRFSMLYIHNWLFLLGGKRQ